ncbi:YSIRK-type signal peptide-containing protein [Streptococcus pseudopneumoniae]|uniref:YSIRK-type signal peptide-containing protein n=2 Tax=Streptococcus TaxID=1301 RepID=UPI00110C344E|nr:YSIRK-type signal peptide-containing protein [Streptococcus pseudopneumoniae]TMR47773.1 YSIRK-type signal peptide-containing protein [Streptococcus pseudopneumoniae]
MDFRKSNREKVFRYSIRKYHFGAASVAVAALMFLGARASVVQADTTVNATEVSLESSEPKSDPAEEGASEASNGSERSADETSNSVQRTPVGSDRDASPSSNNGESSEGSDRSNSSAVSGSDRSAEETSNSGQHAPVRRARSVGEDRASRLNGRYVYGVNQHPVPDDKYNDKEYLYEQWPYAKNNWLNANTKTKNAFEVFTDSITEVTTVRRRVKDPTKTGAGRDNVYRDESETDSGILDIFQKHPNARRILINMESIGENIKVRVIGDSNQELAVLEVPKEDVFIKQSQYDARPVDKSALTQELAQEQPTKETAAYKNADEAKRTAYDQALEAAKAVAAKEGASQAEVEKAKNDLVAAAAALNGQATSKDELKAEIAKEDATKADAKYTNADQAKRTAYDEALKAAKAVAAKEGASQAEVEKAKNDLVAAAAALNGQATSKDELKAEIAKEDATKADAKYTNADQAKRTAYDQALAAAKAVAAKEGASQAEVEKAKNDLVAAAAALNVSDIVAGTQPTSYQTRAMLPNTGIRSDNTTAALGLLSIFGAVGLLFSKKKKDDEEA